MKKEAPIYKRTNRVTGLGDAVGSAIDTVFRKRGFASRDIVTNWGSIAPSPYDKISIPDKLSWPRGEAGAEGAVLYLRCADSHKLALAHEGATVAAAINRYFGYVLVGSVRLAITPFSSGSGQKNKSAIVPNAAQQAEVEQALEAVEDDGIKEALRRLGHNLLTKGK